MKESYIKAAALGFPVRRSITKVEIFHSNNSRELEDALNFWLQELRPGQQVQSIQYATAGARDSVCHSVMIVYTELEALEEVLK